MAPTVTLPDPRWGPWLLATISELRVGLTLVVRRCSCSSRPLFMKV